MDIHSAESKNGRLKIQSLASSKADWMREREWIMILGLKRATQYNGKVGVVMSIFDKHVEIKLLGSIKEQKKPQSTFT